VCADVSTQECVIKPERKAEIDSACNVCEDVLNQQCVVKSEVKAEIGGVCTCGDVSAERFAVKSEVKEETDNKGKHSLHNMLTSYHIYMYMWVDLFQFFRRTILHNNTGVKITTHQT
jgi:hypothetical protein